MAEMPEPLEATVERLVAEALRGRDFRRQRARTFGAVVAAAAGGGGRGDYKYLVEQVGVNVTVYNNDGTVAHGPGADHDVEINWALANLTAARTEKETVKLLGEFSIDASLIVDSFTYLDLTEAKITMANNANTNMFRNSHTSTGDEYIDIVGGILDGNKANEASGHGIYFTAIRYLRILNVTLLNFDDDAIYIVGITNYDHDIFVSGCSIYSADLDAAQIASCSAVVVYNNLVDSCERYGIHLDSCSRRNVVSDNSIYGAAVTDIDIFIDNSLCTSVVGNSLYRGLIGIELSAGKLDAIVGNVIEGTLREGILLAGGCSHSLISSNAISSPSVDGNNTYDGIQLSVNSTENTITGNVIEGSISPRMRHGINCLAPNCTITGNRINEAGTDGILLNGADQCIVIGNRITNSQSYGICIDADADYNSLENNYTSGSVTACVRINNANCDNNMLTNNQFDEGNISDIGTQTRAWLNYDPSANVFITTINAPAVVGGGGGALP